MPKEPLTEDEQTISRSELGKLMRIAWIARPCAIYDAFAAEKKVSGRGILEVLEQGGRILENEGKGDPPSEKKDDFEHMPGFAKFTGERQKDVNKANLMKKNKKIDTSKTHFTAQTLTFLKNAIRKLKWGMVLRN